MMPIKNLPSMPLQNTQIEENIAQSLAKHRKPKEKRQKWCIEDMEPDFVTNTERGPDFLRLPPAKPPVDAFYKHKEAVNSYRPGTYGANLVVFRNHDTIQAIYGTRKIKKPVELPPQPKIKKFMIANN